MMSTAISFEQSIKPLFHQFRSHMRWRFDLTNYDDVKTNAALIAERIKPDGDNPPEMPPPPFSPFTADQIQLFDLWISGGYQP